MWPCIVPAFLLSNEFFRYPSAVLNISSVGRSAVKRNTNVSLRGCDWASDDTCSIFGNHCTTVPAFHLLQLWIYFQSQESGKGIMSYNFRLEIQKFLLYTVNTYACKCDHCWMGADTACQSSVHGRSLIFLYFPCWISKIDGTPLIFKKMKLHHI